MSDKIAVLFVCLGNICRSPTAEAVFKKKAHDAGLDLIIDSAGTHGYHIGSPPDKRSQSAGTDRGYSFSGLKCRRVDDDDFASGSKARIDSKDRLPRGGWGEKELAEIRGKHANRLLLGGFSQ